MSAEPWLQVVVSVCFLSMVVAWRFSIKAMELRLDLDLERRLRRTERDIALRETSNKFKNAHTFFWLGMLEAHAQRLAARTYMNPRILSDIVRKVKEAKARTIFSTTAAPNHRDDDERRHMIETHEFGLLRRLVDDGQQVYETNKLMPYMASRMDLRHALREVALAFDDFPDTQKQLLSLAASITKDAASKDASN